MHPANLINLKHSATIVANELNKHPDKFKSFYRMNLTHFQQIVNLVGPSIKKQETFWREPIRVEERLLITLR